MELIIAFWIVLAIVVAWAANARGRDASFWLLFAIIASPPIAAISCWRSRIAASIKRFSKAARIALTSLITLHGCLDPRCKLASLWTHGWFW